MYMRTFILGKRDSMSASPIPDSFSLAKDGDAQDVQVNVQTQDGNQEQISAADYDPSLDRHEHERNLAMGNGNRPEDDVEIVEEEEFEEEEDDDMDDMFAVDKPEKKKVRKVKKVVVSCHPLIHLLDAKFDL